MRRTIAGSAVHAAPAWQAVGVPPAQLPDAVELDLEEVVIVLGALDRAADIAEEGSEDYRAIRRATILITGKLWPELGAALDDEEGSSLNPWAHRSDDSPPPRPVSDWGSALRTCTG